MSAIVFLTGQTMGDACGSSGRSLRTEFEELGYEFLEVDLTKPNPLVPLDEIIKSRRIEFAYSYVGVCNDLAATTSNGTTANLWEALGVPFVSLYGDSPAYFFDRHLVPGSGFASLYAFPEHCEVRKRLPGVRGALGTLPAVAVEPVAKSALNFPAKQQGKIVFLKNGNDPNRLLAQWREDLSETQFLMMMDLAGELAVKLHTQLPNDIDLLVCSYFLDKGLDIDALLNLRVFFVAQLDDYCRRLKSTLIAESLLDLPIEVHGFNWEHVNFANRRARLVPIADYDASRTLIRDALAVIDMSPNTEIVPHDRCRRSIGSYTLCLTNAQECFKRFRRFSEFSYQFEKESLRHLVSEVLAHPNRYVDLGVEIAEAYRGDEVPNATAQRMLDAAAAIRLERSPRFGGLQNYFGWPVTKN
jgi:hypothetical protein